MSSYLLIVIIISSLVNICICDQIEVFRLQGLEKNEKVDQKTFVGSKVGSFNLPARHYTDNV
jgi:hypothetical protein